MREKINCGKIIPAFDGRAVSVCLAADNNYAPYCGVVIYSLLENGNRNVNYDILILETRISDDLKNKISELMNMRDGISIRFIDMRDYAFDLSINVGAYYTIETNFRLYLFSEMFSEYKRMIYLDCDIVVKGDIDELYCMDLEGMAVGVSKDYTMEKVQRMLAPVFIDNTPYSVENYCKEILHLDSRENYFNAGVLIIDLARSRHMGIELENIIKKLHDMNYFYNDQDVLNITFNKMAKIIDVKWNYINYYDTYNTDSDMKDYYEIIHRDRPAIIHYIGPMKPWVRRNVVDSEAFWMEADRMKKDFECFNGLIEQKDIKASEGRIKL